MEDTEIVELLYAHNEDGIKQTQKKYEKLLKQISQRVLLNSEDALECVNDAYIKIWNVIPPYRPTYLRSFICKITRQLAINKYKYNHRQNRDFNMNEALEEINYEIISKTDVEQDVFTNILGNEINFFIKQLKTDEQIIFVRRYFMCESTKELSNKFNITESNINVMMYRVREKLKSYLLDKGYEIN